MFAYKTANRIQRASEANSNIFFTSKNKNQALSKTKKEFSDSVVIEYALHQAEVLKSIFKTIAQERKQYS